MNEIVYSIWATLNKLGSVFSCGEIKTFLSLLSDKKKEEKDITKRPLVLEYSIAPGSANNKS